MLAVDDRTDARLPLFERPADFCRDAARDAILLRTVDGDGRFVHQQRPPDTESGPPAYEPGD
jgi:hypothetical protein